MSLPPPRSAPAVPPLSLPATPRPMSGRISGRLWIDPRVRFWWLVAAVLLGITIFTAAQRIQEWKLDRDLTRYGTPVIATVGVEGVPRAGYVPPAGTPLTLSFELNGQQQQVTGTLEGQTSPVATAQKVAIRVDPNDLTRWTDLTDPKPLGGYLFIPALMLPVVAAALLAAWWTRRGLVGVWRSGRVEMAVVVDRRQSAMAPMSQVLRCTIPEARDKRLLVVYLPRGSTSMQSGQAIAILSETRNRRPVIAADWLL